MNKQFLSILQQTLITGLENPRSTQKLKILHGFIANDLQYRLNQVNNDYKVYAQGMSEEIQDCELSIEGAYFRKNIDITITKNEKVIAGIEVKFPQTSFNKNCINQFENLLGNTSNIKLRKDDVDYYLMFFIPSKTPLLNSEKKIKRFESVGVNQIEKYGKLSFDKEGSHKTDKTLFYYVDVPNNIKNKSQKLNDYIKLIEKSELKINNSIKALFNEDHTILNNYEKFMKKLTYSLLSK